MKLSRLIPSAVALLLIGPVQAEQIAYTEPVTSYGNNFTILSNDGSVTVGGTNDVIFTWDGTLNDTVAGAVSNATLSSDEAFFGSVWDAHDVTLYGPGSYTVYDLCDPGDPGCGAGNAVGFTVGANQIGAHMLIDWPAGSDPTTSPSNVNIDVVLVWNFDTTWSVLYSDSNPFYTGLDNGTGCTDVTFVPPGAPPVPPCVIDGAPNTNTTVFSFISTDVNSDGIAGNPLTDGAFVGGSPNFNLHLGPPPPGIAVTINVSEGTLQECTETGGTPVTISAETALFGGAELQSIEWTVNGSSFGSGETITTFLGLGANTIEVTATTTTGESDTDSIVVNITDTLAPVLNVGFVDIRSGEYISQIERTNAQWVAASFVATDTCDPNPVASGVGGFSVQNGDLLKIKGNLDTVTMTTSQLVLSAIGTDASGNSSSGSATLLLTD